MGELRSDILTDEESEMLNLPPSTMEDDLRSQAGVLVERLQAMYSHRGDGIPTQFINPDGPEAADTIQSLQSRIAELEGQADAMATTLEWYGDEVFAYSITQQAEPRSAVHGDRGKKAREALTTYRNSKGDGA